MDIVLLKAIYGIASGTVLYILTVLINLYTIHTMLPVSTDHILMLVYFILYFGYIPLMRLSRSYHSRHFTKGITVYYSTSFLTWVALYDALPVSPP